MPVYKDNRGRYFCKFNYRDHLGNVKQKKKSGFKTQKEARAFELEFLTTSQNAIRATVRVFSGIYLNDIKNSIKKRSLQTYQARFLVINRQLGGVLISDLSPLHLKRFEGYLLENYAEATVHETLAILKQCIKHAIRYYGLTYSPFDRFKPRKITTNKRVTAQNVWTDNDFKKFLTADLHLKYKTLYTLLFYTGLRIGEALALTWNDVDLINGTLDVNKTAINLTETSTPKTTSSYRVIDLPKQALDALNDYKSRLYTIDDKSRIFRFTYEIARVTFEKTILKTGCKNITLHGLRHSHASMLINLGASPLLVADRLGHSDIQMTLNVYSHLFNKNKKTLVDLINGLGA